MPSIYCVDLKRPYFFYSLLNLCAQYSLNIISCSYNNINFTADNMTPTKSLTKSHDFGAQKPKNASVYLTFHGFGTPSCIK